MDTADEDKKLTMPRKLVWGARGHPPERAREFLDIWKQYANNITTSEPLPAGHYMQEEMPDNIYDHYTKFFVA